MRYKIANAEIAVPLASFNLHGTMSRAFANICTYTSFDNNVYVFVYRTHIWAFARWKRALGFATR